MNKTITTGNDFFKIAEKEIPIATSEFTTGYHDACKMRIGFCIGYKNLSDKIISIIEGYKEGVDLQEVINNIYYTAKQTS